MSRDQLWQWFRQIDRNGDGHLDAKELQQTLALGNLHFALQTVAHMIRSFDTSRNGTISFDEFSNLHHFIIDTQNAFKHFDRNGDMKLDRREVAQALAKSGFQLDDHAFAALFQAYDPDRSQDLGLAEFLAMTLFLRSASGMFAAFDAQRTGRISLDFNQFIYATSLCR